MTLQVESGRSQADAALEIYQTPVLRDYGTVLDLTKTSNTSQPTFPDNASQQNTYVTGGQGPG